MTETFCFTCDAWTSRIRWNVWFKDLKSVFQADYRECRKLSVVRYKVITQRCEHQKNIKRTNSCIEVAAKVSESDISEQIKLNPAQSLTCTLWSLIFSQFWFFVDKSKSELCHFLLLVLLCTRLPLGFFFNLLFGAFLNCNWLIYCLSAYTLASFCYRGQNKQNSNDFISAFSATEVVHVQWPSTDQLSCQLSWNTDHMLLTTITSVGCIDWKQILKLRPLSIQPCGYMCIYACPQKCVHLFQCLWAEKGCRRGQELLPRDPHVSHAAALLPETCHGRTARRWLHEPRCHLPATAQQQLPHQHQVTHRLWLTFTTCVTYLRLHRRVCFIVIRGTMVVTEALVVPIMMVKLNLECDVAIEYMQWITTK